MTDYTVAVLEDTITLLEILRQNPDGVSLAQLTDSSGFVKNKVFRILFTLEKHHFVQRNEMGLYVLGIRFVEFGQQVKTETLLIEACSSAMDRLVEETGETIFLGVVSGIDALCVDVRESPQSIRLYGQLGRRAPLCLGGVPKTLLAFLPDDLRRQKLDVLYQSDDPPNLPRHKVEDQISEIRRQGYAVIVDELDIGAHSVAAPIYNADGKAVAALSIAGPSIRFSDEHIDRYIDLILEVTEQISETLGYIPQLESI